MLRGIMQLHDKVCVVVFGCPPRWVILDVYAVYIVRGRAIDYEVVHRGPDDSAAPLQGCAHIWLDTHASIEHAHVTRLYGSLQQSPSSTGTPK